MPRVASRERSAGALPAIWRARESWAPRRVARSATTKPTSRIPTATLRRLARSKRLAFPNTLLSAMKIRSHSESHIVELEDGSRWQVFPGDLDVMLGWKPE